MFDKEFKLNRLNRNLISWLWEYSVEVKENYDINICVYHSTHVNLLDVSILDDDVKTLYEKSIRLSRFESLPVSNEEYNDSIYKDLLEMYDDLITFVNAESVNNDFSEIVLFTTGDLSSENK